MRKKIVGIFVMTLMIAAAVLPVVGTMNESKEFILSFNGPSVEWDKSYPGPEFDQFRDVKQTEDGGYIAFGEYTEERMIFARLIKLDSDGNEEWTIINYDLNGTGYGEGELMNSLLLTSDGNYLACGYGTYYYEEEGYDPIWGAGGFLWKVDPDGNTIWLKRIYDIDGITYIAPFHVLEIDDGFIGTGYFHTFTSPDLIEFNGNAGLFKTDLEGNLLWYKTYDFGGYDGGQSVTCCSDGGYYITGETDDNEDYEGICMAMVKTDSEGNKQWDKVLDYPGDSYSYIRETCQADDGDFIICGATGDIGSETEFIIIKIDSSGNTKWEKRYGYDNDDVEFLWGMDKTTDGGYVFALVTDYGKFFGNRDDSWIIKTDENGIAEWKFRIDQEGRQIPISIDQTSDEGFILAYRSGYADSAGTDAFLAKLSSFENDRPDNPATPTGPSRGKPDIDYTFSTDTVSDSDGDMVYYQWDWGDGNFSELQDTNQATYNWTYEDNFEVRVKVIDEHGGESEWSDPLAFSTPRNIRLNQYNTILWRIIEKFPFIKNLI